MNPELLKSYEFAKQTAKRLAKSFYFSSFPLPQKKRLSAYAVYSYCRYCDDWIDNAPPGARNQAEEDLRKLTLDIFEGQIGNLEPEWALAFRHTCLSYKVPIELCFKLIHGVSLDAQGSVRLANWPALREYSYYVASVVGLLMLYVFEPADYNKAQAPAEALGIAMQLTNVLRDVREDARIGRVYLPADELASHGLTSADFCCPEVYKTKEWRKYAASFAERARHYYMAAEPGIALLPDDGTRYCVRCMSRIYAAILDKIQAADWDVSERRYVPFFEKILAAVAAHQASL